MGRCRTGAALVVLSAVLACEPRRGPTEVREELALRERRTAARIDTALAAAEPDALERQPIARWVLPPVLKEVSGLALTADGRLLAHNDERAVVYEVDYVRGIIAKAFSLGQRPALGDFEGIAVAQGRVFLLTSDGRLFESAEGLDGERLPYRVHDTRLGQECEFEGLAYDPDERALVLACKEMLRGEYEETLALFRWPLPAARTPLGGRERLPTRILLHLASVASRLGGELDELSPSGIERDPRTGHYLLLAARERLLVELTPRGEVVAVRTLPETLQQPEGLAIAERGLLFLADEAGQRPATVTVFPFGAAAQPAATESERTDSTPADSTAAGAGR